MAAATSFIEANDLLEDEEALRAAIDERGYLYLKGLIPREVVLETRAQILRLCRDAGWLDPSAPLIAGVWSGRQAYVEGEKEYMEVYRRVLDLPSFQLLPHHPALLGLMRRLFGCWEVLVHPRKIGRIVFPARQEETTPPHQDYPLIKGTARTYTVWVPLGDCPRVVGGLAILPGSHRDGLREHVPTRGTGGTGVRLEGDLEWHSGDMEAGDCLVFHSYTIHRALPNISERYLRLSVDNRYQLASDPIDPSSLRKHYDGWWESSQCATATS